MPWIELHQSLSRHRKTLAAVAALKVDRHKLLGHMDELWWWGLDNADIDGSIGHVDEQTIAEAAGWPAKDAHRFVQALLSCGGMGKPGFLEFADDGYRIHDWYDFAGKLMEKREANKERMQRARAGRTGPEPPPSGGARATHGVGETERTTSARAANMQNTNGARAGATVPDRTGPLTPDGVSSESEETSPGDDRVDEVYSHFKARVQPRSRLCPRKKIAARLKRFSVAELREGIDRFADNPWWMEHNATQGAEWFFESDRRSEQFLLMQPRPASNVVPMGRRPIEPPRHVVDNTGVAR